MQKIKNVTLKTAYLYDIKGNVFLQRNKWKEQSSETSGLYTSFRPMKINNYVC